MMHQIVLAGPIPEIAKKLFHQRCEGRYTLVDAPDQQHLNQVLDGTYYVLRGAKMGADLIGRLSEGTRLIHRWGVGYDSVDIKAAGERGIRVAICAGVNSQSVAELAVLLMLASFRRFPKLLDSARHGSGDKDAVMAQTRLIQEKRVGLVGLGNIGRRVARMVQGFGAEVVYYDAFRVDEKAEKELGVQFMPLDDLLRTSDIVSIHVPLMDSTNHLIDAAKLAEMKPTALLVNTARGGIVDTPALMAALKEKRLWGAALDTIEGEPLPAGHEIFGMDNVMLTPHAGGNTSDINIGMVKCVMDNIDAMERGGEPERRCVVNAEFLR